MKAAWSDPDDSKFSVDIESHPRLKKLTQQKQVTGSEYTELLRNLHEKSQTSTWHSQPQVSKPSSLSQIIASCEDILSAKFAVIPPDILSTSQLPHGNAPQRSEGCLTSLDFHQNLLLCGSLDKTVSVFSLENESATHLSTSHYYDMPVTSAYFYNETIISAGKRPFFYTYNYIKQTIKKIPLVNNHRDNKVIGMKFLLSRKILALGLENGEIRIYNLDTLRHLHTLTMTQPASVLAFAGEDFLISAGADAELYIWDLSTARCVKRIWDISAVNISALGASSSHIASGSTTGAINLYSLADLLQAPSPVPLHSFLNLTTSVTSLNFNYSGDLLLASSKWKRGALKVYNMHSFTAYKNFPAVSDHIQYPQTSCFNTDSSLLAIGNDEGNSLLYKLTHYSN